MNAVSPLVHAAPPEPLLVELLRDLMALARKIEAALDPAPVLRPSTGSGPQDERANEVSPMRAAEIEAEQRMRAGMAKTIARSTERHLAERRALVLRRAQDKLAAEVAPAPSVVHLPVFKLGPVDPGSRRSFLPRVHRTLAEIDGLPGAVTIDQPLPTPQPVPEPVLGSHAPALLDEAQHCHSLTSADEHTEDAGAKRALAEPAPIPAPAPLPPRPITYEQRRAKGLRTATERLMNGGKPTNQFDRVVLKEIERRQQDADRLSTALGRAMAWLQRKMPVYRAEVAGGEKGMFQVGRREPMTGDELIAYATARGWIDEAAELEAAHG